VVDLPFIDADLLLETLQQVLDKDEEGGNILSPSERRRNQRGQIHVFHASKEPADSDDVTSATRAKRNSSSPKSLSPSPKRKSQAKSRKVQHGAKETVNSIDESS
jgi:5'-3' exonuclease